MPLSFLLRFSTKKSAPGLLPYGEQPDALCATLIWFPAHREEMRIAVCSLWCRERMRAVPYVVGLVRVSLAKRTHQPVVLLS
jgi:hypothetical protein